MDLLEEVQRRARKMIRGLEHLLCEESREGWDCPAWRSESSGETLEQPDLTCRTCSERFFYIVSTSAVTWLSPPLKHRRVLVWSTSHRTAGVNAQVEHSIKKEHNLDNKHPRQQREKHPRERWNLFQKKEDTESQQEHLKSKRVAEKMGFKKKHTYNDFCLLDCQDWCFHIFHLHHEG